MLWVWVITGQARTGLWAVVRAMAPDRSFEALRAATRHICRIAEPVINKRDRIVPARDLNTLGFDLMQSAASCGTAFEEAALYRDGLMIALLIAIPVRLGNFTSIEIDRHLLKQGDDHWLAFPSDEVKNHRPLDYRLPEALKKPMERYLSVYRPRLLERRNQHYRDDRVDALWITEQGKSMGRRRIWDLIKSHTKERFGFPITPHGFRYCAATSIATEIPEHVGIVQPVLGHADAATGERFYNQARSFEVASRFQAGIESLRNEG